MLSQLLRTSPLLTVSYTRRRGTGAISCLRSLRQSRQHQERLAFISTNHVRRKDHPQDEGLVCVAAVNAQTCTNTAVDDCLERVLGSSANSTTEFAVLFFEGHRGFDVQEALSSFSSRRPQAPPVIGCSLGDGGERQKEQILRARASSPDLSSATGEAMSMPRTFRTPSIVTVLGLGFGGRVEAIPVSADGGSFPSIAGDDSISRIFALPQEKQPLFFMLSRCTNPISDLDETFSRLGNLLPGCTRLSAASSGDPSSVVSSFPAEGAQVLGVCLLVSNEYPSVKEPFGSAYQGDISLKEQVDLARKTLGAFGVDDVSVTGGVCDEIFVPSLPTPAPTTPPRLDSWKPLVSSPEIDKDNELDGKRQELVEKQHCVFMVEDFVFPGMTRRFRIFEPRYRVLVKRCLSEAEPLVILPLSRGGNTVGTAVYVSGLHNVEEDGRCEIEVTGVSRCHVKTMWMRGESFGLHEAVVEYFKDERPQHINTNSDTDAETVGQHPRSDLTSSSATGSGDQGVPYSRDGCEWVRVEDKEQESESVELRGGGGGGKGVSDGHLAADLPESELLRIQVSAMLQRELFRTRKTGRSPLWPRSIISEFSPCTASRGNGDIVDGETATGVEPSDLDAEELSYWAAQNVESDVLTKHRWLSSISTEERLREVRDVCEAIMSRHRDRRGIDDSLLSKPFSALKGLRTK